MTGPDGRPPVRREQSGGVRWLHLSRPHRRNALDVTLIEALEQEVAAAEVDDSVRVVVVAGDGPSFSAGGDFTAFLALGDGAAVVGFLRRISGVFARIEASNKPWVAALHGHAIAGGLELALVCDVVVAASGTRIGDGHVLNQLLPGAGSSVRLERAVGFGPARWLHLSGETVPAEDLAPTGWLHAVVPPDALHGTAERVAQQLAARHGGTQQNMKRLLNTVGRNSRAAGLAHELEAFELNWEQHDVATALRSFLARRRSSPTPQPTSSTTDQEQV